jgi:phosphatidylglycerol:prolipoprotein diacylglycerol transferase
MIPYFSQPRLDLGLLTIHAFGALVALAVIVGTEVLRRRARTQGLDPDLAARLVGWVLIGGFIGAHLVDRLVYNPAETLADPLSIVKIWAGLSSFGGFLGAIVGAVLFIRSGRLKGRTWAYLDAVAYAWTIGWIFGRTGCFLAFDHPGVETTFFLAQQDHSGVVRHNLGLDEALYTVVMAAVVVAVGRKRLPDGFILGLVALLYAPVRFGLDFLRKVDVRYFGLTPGQYGSLALLVVGIWIVYQARQGRFERTSSATVTAPTEPAPTQLPSTAGPGTLGS